MSRALVLSGGGPVGIAWETGIVAGLAAEGVDLATADLIVGTSAGSVVGAQIAMGSDMGALSARYREQGLPGSTGRSSQPPSAEPERMTKLMEAMAELFTSDAPPEERRAKIGAFALSATTAPEEAFVANIASMIGAEDASWPRRYTCTAVDANTGAFVEWDEAKRVDLGRAVASSCAVPGIFPPITIGEGRYVDGGMRSVTNADLANGHDRVVVISLIGGERASPMFAPVAEMIREEIDMLEGAGGKVEVVAPDEATATALGPNLMDPSVAPQAAEAGLRQGAGAAERLRDLWG